MEITGEHEDLIWKNKQFIQELTNIQELYFDTLVDEMGLTKRGGEFLFDFIFNHKDEKDSFEEYLEKYAINFPIYLDK